MRMFSPAVKTVLMTADTVGGVWTYALDLARGLEPYEIQILLVTMGGLPDRQQRRQVRQLEHVTLKATPLKLEWMDDPWGDVQKAGDLLLELEAGHRPDVVHLNGYCHGAIGFKSPVLMVGHSCVYSWHHAVHRRLPGTEWQRYRRRVAEGLRAADLVTAPTRTMLRDLRRFYGNFNAAPPVFNGRDFKPLQVKKEPFVFCAGRLWDEAKNIRCLQEAAQLVRWPIRVAGQSRHPNGGTIHFPNLETVGMLDTEAVRSHLSRASIFALPVKYEPFGLSALEAALCGCALVLGDLASLREVWQDAAVYVNPDDCGQTARQINRLIDEPARLEDYRRRAIHQAQRYTLRRMSEGYMKLYHQLKAGRTGGLQRASVAVF